MHDLFCGKTKNTWKVKNSLIFIMTTRWLLILCYIKENVTSFCEFRINLDFDSFAVIKLTKM